MRTLLHAADYSLQATAKKAREGSNHPDRDAQFQHLNAKARLLAAGEPVISVDTKKKELIGRSRKPGRRGSRWASRRWCWTTISPTRSAKPSRMASTMWRATTGWVTVGQDHDTPASRWRPSALVAGRRPAEPIRGPRALITADAGGSNGDRRAAWKLELQRFADDDGGDD